MAPIPGALGCRRARRDESLVLVGRLQAAAADQALRAPARRGVARPRHLRGGRRAATCSTTRAAGRRICVALREQRRMHPHISAISNRFVYAASCATAPTPATACSTAGSTTSTRSTTRCCSSTLRSSTPGSRASTYGGRSLASELPLGDRLRRHRADAAARRPRAVPAGEDTTRSCSAAPYRPHASLLSSAGEEQARSARSSPAPPTPSRAPRPRSSIFDLVNDEPHWRVGMFERELDEDQHASAERRADEAAAEADRRR